MPGEVNNFQQTIRREREFVGIGLHNGRVAKVNLRPLDENSGILFRRMDLNKKEIPADSANVSDTLQATTLRFDGAEVGTVEHLLSALAVLGIDNLLVEVDSPELPILDGSAAPWMLFLLSACGISRQRAAKRFIRVKKTVEIKDGSRSVSFLPNDGWVNYRVTIDYPHSVVQRSGNHFAHTLSAYEYGRDISRARTFCYLNDVELMRKNRRALGGSLANAVVYDDNGILNEEGLRYENEFVRHKVLDVIGDCYVNGNLILSDYEGVQPGHKLNNQLMRALMADKEAWEYVEAPLN